jgi:hypothetical protein
MELMIPVWNHAPAPQIAMKKLQDLRGAQVALVDDNYDEPFTTRLEQLLTERFGAIVNRLVKPLGSAPSPKSLIDKAAQAQVAIVGIAL